MFWFWKVDVAKRQCFKLKDTSFAQARAASLIIMLTLLSKLLKHNLLCSKIILAHYYKYKHVTHSFIHFSWTITCIYFTQQTCIQSAFISMFCISNTRAIPWLLVLSSTEVGSWWHETTCLPVIFHRCKYNMLLPNWFSIYQQVSHEMY